MLVSPSPLAFLSSPPPPPLRLISSPRLSSLFSPFRPCRRNCRRRTAAALSISSSTTTTTTSNVRAEAFAGRRKAQLAEVEGYGVDPLEFVSSSPAEKPRRKNRREVEHDKRMDSKRAAPRPPEETKPRTTHKLLQVLGGKARRKKLLSPKGMDVRPMMEVVKGAAFDILQAAGGCPAALRPGRWLDLYSGTGSVGIEAISRGCSEVHFVEMDPWVVSEVLRPNLEWTGFLDVSVIHTLRVERFLKQVEEFPDDRKFDYISVTPPYTAVDYGVLMEQLSRSSVIGEDCFIMVEYPLETSMVDSCSHLIKIADRRFGRTNLIIYGPKWAEKKKKSDRRK